MELETPSSPVETPGTPEAPPAEDASIASHSAQFDRTKQEPAEAVETAALPKERHRAKSQQARAEDVPRIKELTGKWRAEQERANRLEQELTQARQPREAAATPRETRAEPAPAGEKFPPFADWLDTNPGQEYEDYLDARWSHKQQGEATKGREAQYQQSVQQAQAYKMEAYGERLKEFASSRPDFGQKLQATITAVNDQIPTLLYEAIIQDDNGPALLYALGSDPVFRDDMILLSDGKAVTDASVANLRRRLNLQLSRSQAGTTGSATATPPQSWTARPPNPVRTGPVTTGDEPPGEGASISDHAKYFMPKRR